MNTLEILFFVLLFIVFYTYVGYGILLWILVKIKQSFISFYDTDEPEQVWGIQRSGFFNGRGKWAKGFENQMV